MRAQRGNLVGTSIFLRLFAVILGPVPRILLQQGTNLVNKFALLFHKCWFAQDSRDKPEDDGCFWRWLNACCNAFKHPSPDTNVSTSPSRGEVLKHVLFSQCVPDATGFLSDVYKKGTRARNFLADGVQCGKNMIEMLGVLAIIGVLSVGGIAGYSKAMEKFKINKLLNDYSMLTFGILEHLDDFKKSHEVSIDALVALNFLPQDWVKDTTLTDDFNNKLELFIRESGNGNGEKDEFIMDIYLGGRKQDADAGVITQNFSEKLCVELFQNLFIPLHAYAVHAEVYRSSGSYYSFAGDRYCTSANKGMRKCMVDVTLDDIHKACNSCGKTNEYCNVNIHF